MYSTNYGIGRYTNEIINRIILLNLKQPSPHELILFFNNPEYSEFHIPKEIADYTKKVLVDARHYSISEQFKFLRTLYAQNLDTIHFAHFNIPLLYNRPFSVTIHDLTLTLFKGQKMNRFYQRMAYNLTIRHAVKKSKKIIAVSNNTKNDIIRYFGVSPDKIKVTHLGLNEKFKFMNTPDSFAPTLKKFNLTNQQFLLYAGVWRAHKNIPRLIEAFRLLKDKYSVPYKLVLTGKKEAIYHEVPDTIKRLHLEKDVIMTDSVTDEELVHLYNAAYIFVFPSLYEGFGFPPLESMKCGTPVAASFTSSIPEVLGENAIFFDPYNIENMAEQIHELATNVDLQVKLIERGLNHANTFSWDRTTEETYKIIIG